VGGAVSEAARDEPVEKRRRRRTPRRRPPRRVPAGGSGGAGRGGGHGVRAWLGELSTTVKAIGGLAGAVATIAGLVFLFVPDLMPSATPDEGSATLSKPTVELPVSFGQYLDRVEIPREGYRVEQLQEPGVLVGAQVSIKGYRGRALPLRWYVLDESTHDIVDQQSKRHTLTADRQETPVAWPFWVALPRAPGPFTVVLQIYPPSAKPGRPGVVPLAEARTDPFPGGPDQ
jgi:hypothetical protein